MFRLNAAVSALALSVLASLSASGAQRVFVASYGSDANTANNCSFLNPCRGFTAAMTIVDPDGEVVALDAAGYGSVTITKSVTITANPGFYAGISAGTGNAVTMATASTKVILRGLNINGVGATGGITVSNGASLTIENCVISNFPGDAVFATGFPGTLRISDTTIRGNGTGIRIQGGVSLDLARSSLKANSATGLFVSGIVVGTTTVATVSDTVAAGNGEGFRADSGGTAGARIALIRSTASHNGTGVHAFTNGAGTAEIYISSSMVIGNTSGLKNDAATLESQGNNTVRYNYMADTTGTITAVGGL